MTTRFSVMLGVLFVPRCICPAVTSQPSSLSLQSPPVVPTNQNKPVLIPFVNTFPFEATPQHGTIDYSCVLTYLPTR